MNLKLFKIGKSKPWKAGIHDADENVIFWKDWDNACNKEKGGSFFSARMKGLAQSEPTETRAVCRKSKKVSGSMLVLLQPLPQGKEDGPYQIQMLLK